MLRKEWVKKTANETGKPLKDVDTILRVATDIIINTVKMGEDVKIINFGKFSTTIRSKHKGTDPVTKQKIIVNERRVPKFKPGKKFKDSCKEKNMSKKSNKSNDELESE